MRGVMLKPAIASLFQYAFIMHPFQTFVHICFAFLFTSPRFWHVKFPLFPPFQQIFQPCLLALGRRGSRTHGPRPSHRNIIGAHPGWVHVHGGPANGKTHGQRPAEVGEAGDARQHHGSRYIKYCVHIIKERERDNQSPPLPENYAF